MRMRKLVFHVANGRLVARVTAPVDTAIAALKPRINEKIRRVVFQNFMAHTPEVALFSVQSRKGRWLAAWQEKPGTDTHNQQLKLELEPSLTLEAAFGFAPTATFDVWGVEHVLQEMEANASEEAASELKEKPSATEK